MRYMTGQCVYVLNSVIITEPLHTNSMVYIGDSCDKEKTIPFHPLYYHVCYYSFIDHRY